MFSIIFVWYSVWWLLSLTFFSLLFISLQDVKTWFWLSKRVVFMYIVLMQWMPWQNSIHSIFYGVQNRLQWNELKMIWETSFLGGCPLNAGNSMPDCDLQIGLGGAGCVSAGLFVLGELLGGGSELRPSGRVEWWHRGSLWLSVWHPAIPGWNVEDSSWRNWGGVIV